jgi:ubiquinone/menaquinone biosynthesis C-methylase UbiE
MKSKNTTCRICGNTENNTVHTLTERHFGFNDTFNYLRCSSCGCFQIANYPENISKYYPPEYNAYDQPKIPNHNRLLSTLIRLKTLHVLREKPNFIGWVFEHFLGPGFTGRLQKAGVHINDAILDVGSGTGHRLHMLREKGFTDLTGTDIFIEDDIFYNNGIKIYKQDLAKVEKQYDFVMLNHSFEHMPNQHDVLKHIYRVLKPGKFALIRIPVFSTYMWDTYGDYWIGLEPPRHYYMHTPESMKQLAKQSQLELSEIIFESSEYQLIGSEQYKKGISRVAPNSYFTNPAKSKFSPKKVEQFKELAKELDQKSEGFSACFYLQKPNENR